MHDIERHHRIPRSRGGSNSPRNLIYVPRKAHGYYHALFGNMTAFEIAQYLNTTWIDPDLKLVVRKRKHECESAK